MDGLRGGVAEVNAFSFSKGQNNYFKSMNERRLFCTFVAHPNLYQLCRCWRHGCFILLK